MSNLAIKKEQTFTYADYLTWDDDERWELIDGVVYNMSPAPMRKHQKILVKLSRILDVYLDGKPCEVYVAPFDVRFAEKSNDDNNTIDSVVQPDISVICNEMKLDDYGCIGSPDLIIEILSPSTAKKDKTVKFKLYEKYGVKEYWVVHPDENIIEIFKLSGDAYLHAEVYGKDDSIEVKLLGELIIDVNQIFGM